MAGACARAIPAAARLREVELRHSGTVLSGSGGGTPTGLQHGRGPAARRHGRAPRVQQRMPVPAALLRRQRRLQSTRTLDASERVVTQPSRASARPRQRLRRGGALSRRKRRRIARSESAAQQSGAARGRGTRHGRACGMQRCGSDGRQRRAGSGGPAYGAPRFGVVQQREHLARRGGREKPQARSARPAARAAGAPAFATPAATATPGTARPASAWSWGSARQRLARPRLS
jgi:hypothetical protein